tara:strand:+ start:981 stop:1208 length:228 start_codon:yes stop_codon:yes gene_type:complete
MTKGNDLNIDIDLDELRPIKKQYKKLRKYMKSNLYQIKEMDGTEKVVSNLLKEYQDEFVKEQKDKFVSENTKELD